MRQRKPAHPSAATARLLRAVAVALLVCVLAFDAQAQQRNPDQRMGRTVLDEASPHYRFESFAVDSPDGRRRWLVRVGIPTGKPPTDGFPAFWMLDGNAALMNFDRELLADLARNTTPVLVFVGYDNDLRIDSPARTRDYTFLADTREGSGDPGERIGGGADAFLDVIERRIRPQVAAHAPIDPRRQTLWAHSLGGLFVLHALYTRTGAFDTYAAGSPSLWWRGGAMLGESEQQFVAHNAGRQARVLLMLGGGERQRDTSNRDMNNPRVVEHLRRVSGAPPGAAAALAERLKQVPGLDVSYREFPGLGHGPMFRASLMATLHAVAGVTDRSQSPAPSAAP